MLDISLQNIIHYPRSTAQISDFRGKLLILDFWESWCKGCLVLMPTVRQLQQKYGERIQLLAVTAQQAAAIEKLARINPLIRDNPIPMVTADKQLAAMFPHKWVPHLVWISPDGTYLGATDHTELKEKTIDRVLQTGKAAFGELKQDVLQFDQDKPLFNISTELAPNFLFRSALTPYQPGVPFQSGLDRMGDTLRMYGINTDLFHLNCHVLSVFPEQFTPNKIVYSDSLIRQRFRYNSKWKNKESLYCYEIVLPKTKKAELYSLMREELRVITGIEIKLVNQETDCYLLVTAPEVLLMQRPTAPVVPIKTFGLVSDLVLALNNHPGMLPVIDESGIEDKVAITLPRIGTNITELNKDLRPYGLMLKRARRNMDIMYVSTSLPSRIDLTE